MGAHPAKGARQGYEGQHQRSYVLEGAQKHSHGMGPRPFDVRSQLKLRSQVINVFSYLNHPAVHAKMVTILNEMREEIVRADQTWIDDSDPNHTSTGIVKHWDVWLENHFSDMVTNGRAFVSRNVGELTAFWLGQPRTVQREAVLLDCKTLGSQINLVTIDRSGIDGQT